jgi:NAD(P)-dependent dehydrogenase (short-subunit alcohol dehydrogenase family)
MQRVAILGATGSIGNAIARRLIGKGCSVLLLGRNAAKLAALSQELNQPFAEVDLSSSGMLEELLKTNAETEGRFTGIVNCVGSVILKPAHSTSDEEFRQTLETNLFTAFATIRAGSKVLREHGGSIVLFGSAAAEIGIQNHEAIAAAKAGIIGMARSAAATYAPYNIRVNVVSPGLVRSEMTKRIWENPASAAASCSMHALGRLGEPDQVASLATWLLDSENNWVTGQVIGIDGGLGHVLARR